MLAYPGRCPGLGASALSGRMGQALLSDCENQTLLSDCENQALLSDCENQALLLKLLYLFYTAFLLFYTISPCFYTFTILFSRTLGNASFIPYFCTAFPNG
jgi:hypothetical protein